MYDERYEVRVADIEKKLKNLGQDIAEGLPEGWGFMLFITQFGKDGSNFYISNANRDDMMKVMQEWIEREKKKNG